MGYPGLDRGTRFLMLTHQLLEEARAQGDTEPQLEFREDSEGLTISSSLVDGTDDTSKMRLEGTQASDLLRSLEADGCVDLDCVGGELSAHTGSFTITEEGLNKIKYRRAFEANLPRLSKKWLVSLLGPEVGFVFSKLWRASWEGRQISVRNRQNFVLRRRQQDLARSIDEYLNVEGRFPPGYRVFKSRFSKDLYGELRTADGTHELHAQVGLTAPMLQAGCLIRVDGVVIGGDVGKKFLT